MPPSPEKRTARQLVACACGAGAVAGGAGAVAGGAGAVLVRC